MMKKIKKMFLLILLSVFILYAEIISAQAAALEKPVIKKVTEKSYNSLEIKWKKVKGASGYGVYRKTAKTAYKRIAYIYGSSKCNFVDRGLATGTKYYYAVRAYKKSGRKTIWSSYSRKVSGTPRLDIPSIISVESVGSGKSTVTWKKVTGASGYQVYRADSEEGVYRKIKTVKGNGKTSYTDEGLSGGNSCYYRIRAYRTVKNKKVYSEYSSAKARKESGSGGGNGGAEPGGSGNGNNGTEPGGGGNNETEPGGSGNGNNGTEPGGGGNDGTKPGGSGEDETNPDKGDPDEDETDKPEVIKVTGIRLDGDKSIQVNQQISLTAVVTPENATDKTVIWSSSNTEAAVVDENGKVTGMAAGKAVITAKTANGKTASCTVTIGVTESVSFDDFSKAAAELVKENKTLLGNSIAANNKFFAKRLIVKGNGMNLDFSKVKATAVVKGVDNIYLVQFATSSDARDAMGQIGNWANVRYVEPDSYNEGSAEVDTESFRSWGVTRIGADKLAEQASSVTSAVIEVAVVDSGVSAHEFLGTRVSSDGYDFVDNDSSPADLNGHGTHVSGTIVDCTPGVNARIMPVRVLDSDGHGYSSIVGMGIRYAADHGAKVINMSLGGGHSNYTDENIKYAISKGVTVVVAAGNDYSSIDALNACPAHMTEVICVGAVDSNEKKADFSNVGSSLDVVAPGVGIVSCVPGGRYERWDGTSMATPHVSALAAMLKLLHPSYTPAQIEQEIKNNTRDLGNTGRDNYYGYGIPDFSSSFSVEPSGISLDQSSVTIGEGETFVLTATVSPANATDKTVTWKSSDTDTASVDNGTVKGKSAGTAVITAETVNGKTASCRVTVKAASPVEPSGISLDQSSVTIEEGKTFVLTATVSPANAADKTVTWKSSDTDTASVDNGTVKGKSAGTAVITAETVNGKTASCRVTVKAASSVEPSGISLNQSSVTIEEGETFVLTATVSPANATDKTVTWRSSDTDTASVDSGTVKGKSAGTAVITAETVNGKTASCHVTVKPKEVPAELKLNYSEITLYAEDHDYIAVFALEGNVIHVNPGEYTQAGINVNFQYSNLPGLQLKAYLNNKEIPADQITWSRKENYGYGIVDEKGYVSGGSESMGFVTMSTSPARKEQVITASLKSNPDVTASVAIHYVLDAQVSFSTADPGIAEVDSKGMLYGKRPGTTTLTMKSGLTGRSASCPVSVGETINTTADVVYLENGQFHSINSYGGPDYVPVSNKKNFYLKVGIDASDCPGSTLELALHYGAGHYNVGTVNWSDSYLRQDGFCYYPLELWYEMGSIKLYYQITLADGRRVHPMNKGSDDAFFLRLLNE